MSKLTQQEIIERLAQLSGWTSREHWIEKTYRFKNFARAMLFVNAVGHVAESLNHHPDFIIHYNEVTLRNWTHTAEAVTERDFMLAERIEHLFGE